jgi:hypothetical protein
MARLAVVMPSTPSRTSWLNRWLSLTVHARMISLCWHRRERPVPGFRQRRPLAQPFGQPRPRLGTAGHQPATCRKYVDLDDVGPVAQGCGQRPEIVAGVVRYAENFGVVERRVQLDPFVILNRGRGTGVAP